MHTTSKLTIVYMATAEYISALEKIGADDHEARHRYIKEHKGKTKCFYLKGRWGEDSLRNYIKRTFPSFSGEVSVSHNQLNYSKYGLDKTENRFKFVI